VPCLQKSKGAQKFSLDVRKLVTVDEEANTVALRDALPELLVCTLHAMAAAVGRGNDSVGELRLQRTCVYDKSDGSCTHLYAHCQRSARTCTRARQLSTCARCRRGARVRRVDVRLRAARVVVARGPRHVALGDAVVEDGRGAVTADALLRDARDPRPRVLERGAEAARRREGGGRERGGRLHHRLA
jgi:hypothetical protein